MYGGCTTAAIEECSSGWQYPKAQYRLVLAQGSVPPPELAKGHTAAHGGYRGGLSSTDLLIAVYQRLEVDPCEESISPYNSHSRQPGLGPARNCESSPWVPEDGICQ